MSLFTDIKLFLTLTVIVLLSSANALAQDSGNDYSISISTQILESIELLTIRSIDISNVQPSQGTIYISPTRDAEAGMMKAQGRPGADIRISFLSDQVLTSTGSDGAIAFEYLVTGNDKDEQETSEMLEPENQNFQLNEDGEYFFWIGGTATVSGAPGGNYSGEFTIEVDYN